MYLVSFFVMLVECVIFVRLNLNARSCGMEFQFYSGSFCFVLGRLFLYFYNILRDKPSCYVLLRKKEDIYVKNFFWCYLLLS